MNPALLSNYLRDPGSIRLLVEYGVRRGLTAQQLLNKSGLKPEQLCDPWVEVQSSQELTVIGNLLSALGNDPLLGLEVGWEYGFSTFGLWGFALISSPTLGDALQLALRYLPLTYVFSAISARQINQRLVLRFSNPELAEPLRSFLIQRDMAAAARLMSDLGGSDLLQQMVCSCAAPKDTRKATVAGVAVEFGHPFNALFCDPRPLSQALPQANPLAHATCQQLCQQLIEQRRARLSSSALVRMYLLSECSDGLLNLAQVAQRLHVSERTLKRRLQQEGGSFSQILAQVRQELAADMLAAGTLSLSQIAELLGFADSSSFSQAFRRWHGVAPGSYKKRSSAVLAQ